MSKATTKKAFFACAAVVFTAAWMTSAGPITPPAGPVTPTDKPLADIEPRIVVRQADIPLSITSPGSYVLAEIIEPQAAGQVAVTIDASNVTFDLGGFGFKQNDGAFLTFVSAIRVAGLRENVRICNGTIRGCLSDGVDASAAEGTVVEGVRFSSNGGDGAALGDAGMIIGCVSRENFGAGFSGGDDNVVRNCVADQNTGHGFLFGDSTAMDDCVATDNLDRGIDVGAHSVVDACVARGNVGFGIIIGQGSALTDSSASNSAVGANTTTHPGAGIFLGAYSSARGCAARNNAHVGIDTAVTGGVTVVECAAGANDSSGFSIASASTVKDCTSRNNGFAGFTISSDCTVTGSTASLNADDGFSVGGGSTVDNCTADNNGRGSARDGFDLAATARATNCSSSNNSDDGFSLSASTSVMNCISTNNTDDGFDLTTNATVVGCTGSNNGGNGFEFDQECVIKDNYAASNGANGFEATDPAGLDYNRVFGNTARSNTNDGFLFNNSTWNTFYHNAANDGFNFPGAAFPNAIGPIQVGIAGNAMIPEHWANWEL